MTGTTRPARVTCTFCRRTRTQGLVCDTHYDGLHAMLDPRQLGQIFTTPGERHVPPSIPVLWAMLDVRRPTLGYDSGGSTIFRSSPPADLARMAMRDPRTRAADELAAGLDDWDNIWSPLRVLWAIVRRVDRRTVDGQPEPKPHPEVTGCCRWLLSRLDWLTEQDWLLDARHDLHALHNQLRGAWGDAPPRPVGRCDRRVDDDGNLDGAGKWRCGNPLFLSTQPLKGADEPVAVTLPSLRCGSCRWTYTGTELARLGREHGWKDAAS